MSTSAIRAWPTFPVLAFTLIASPAAEGQQLDGTFASPMLWERFTDYTFRAGPYRSYPDGKGGVFLTGSGGLDMVGGQWVPEPIRLHEKDASVDTSFHSEVSYCSTMAIQPDGRILVDTDTGDADVLVRLTTSGALDPSFQPLILDQSVRHALVLPASGKILVVAAGSAGILYQRPPPSAVVVGRKPVLRLDSNGRIDESFNRPEFSQGFSLYAPPVCDSAGRIYLGGNFTSINGTGRVNIARLFPDGALDESFTGGSSVPGGLGGIVRRVDLQSDGHVLASGDMRIAPGPGPLVRSTAIRFSAEGQFDDTFKSYTMTELGLGDYPRDMLMQGDKFVLVSRWLRRFNADGTLDSQFTPSNFKTSFTISELSDGRLLVPGENSADGIAAFSKDGVRDDTFHPGGFGSTKRVEDLAVLEDGRFALSGAWNRVGTNVQLGVELLNPLTGSASQPQPNLVQAAPGASRMGTGASLNRVARGAAGTCWFLGCVGFESLDEQALFGRFLSSGQFEDLSSLSGVLDATDLYGLRDGRLLTIGNSGRAVVARTQLLRLNAGGQLDQSFAGLPEGLRNQLGRAVWNEILQTYEEVDVGTLQILTETTSSNLIAAISAIDGTCRLVRLDYDGVADPSFVSPVNEGLLPQLTYEEVFNSTVGAFEQPINGIFCYRQEIYSYATELADGKLLVCGRFSGLGGVSVPHLARLNQNGSLDTTFPGVVLECSNTPFWMPRLDSLEVDAQGRIYVAGRFDRVNQVPAAGLARLLADGTVDPAFHSPLSYRPDGSASCLAIAAGALYVSGPYISSDGQKQPLWRLNLQNPLKLEWQRGPGGEFQVVVPSDAERPTILQSSPDLGTWTDIFTNAPGTAPAVFADLASIQQARNYFRLLRP